MRAALLILRKDLLLRARDRTVWILGLVAPLALAGVLGLVVGGFGPPSLAPPVWAVVNQDVGAVGASFANEVLPSIARGLDGSVTAAPDVSSGIARIEAGDLDALFVVPSGLTAGLAADGSGTIEVVGHVGADLQNAVAAAVARQWAGEVAVVRSALVASVANGGGSAGQIQQFGFATGGAPALVTMVALDGADRTMDGETYVAAGMGVFFLFFTVGLGVIGLLEEKQSGTLPRLQAAPITGWSIVLGKILTSLVLGYVATVVLVATSTLLLGASWGPTMPVLLLVAAAVLAATSLVTVVASFAESADAANNVQGVIGIVLGMLGGAFFPVATEPGPLATASDLTPHGMFLTAVGDLQVPGAGLGAIAPQLLGLLAFALVTATAGGAITRLREVA